MKHSRSILTAWLASLLLPCLSACTPQGHVLLQSPVPPGISVSGHGEARGKPDIARVTIGVETRARLATEATEQANQQMSAVTAAIQKYGVSEADIRTQNFSINFEQPPEPYPPAPYAPSPQALPEPAQRKGAAQPAADVPKGFYRVSNQMLVTIRKLDELGALLAAVTGAGANNIWGIQLEIENPAPLETEAREKAVAEAKARAEQLARLAGVKLGRLVSISANGDGPVMRESGFAFGMKAAQSDVPVQRGELTVNQDVQLVYALE
jgi:uncharacterized protein YggE